jgi:hypothetical protein
MRADKDSIKIHNRKLEFLGMRQFGGLERTLSHEKIRLSIIAASEALSFGGT